MRYQILLSAILFTASISKAQLIYPAGQDSTFIINNEYADVLFLYKNAGTTAVNIKWEKLSEQKATGWAFGFCNNGQCISELPDTGTYSGLQPNEQGFLKIHTSTNRIAGTSLIKYLIYTEGNRNTADTFTYHIVCDPWAVGISGLNESGQYELTQKMRTIEVKSGQPSTLMLINMRGEQVLNRKTATEHLLELDALPAGVYVLVNRFDSGPISRKIVLR